MMQKLQKCIFFKINVFRNAFQREAKKIEGCNQSEQDKIVFTELYNTFFRFNLSFSNAELHRFLWSLLAGNTLYATSIKHLKKIGFRVWRQVTLSFLKTMYQSMSVRMQVVTTH